MAARTVIFAWAALVLLSLSSTAVSRLDASPYPVAGAAVLLIAWLKARLILLHYLGLARAPRWKSGALAAMALAIIILSGLWAAG